MFPFFQCRETFWIESLHTVMLIYVPKRIHFGDDTYNMRVELAVIDWVRMLTCDYSEPKENILVTFIPVNILQNENVNREVSSLQMYQHARHPNRLAETRVLVEKTFNFRAVIWSHFFELNNWLSILHINLLLVYPSGWGVMKAPRLYRQPNSLCLDSKVSSICFILYYM